jgi:SH3 domain-containing YSC84-like protein 1
MKKWAISLAAIVFAAMPAVSLAASDKEDDIARTQNATRVFHEIMEAPDGIPQSALQKARCIAIIPGDKKFAFILGANYGRGLAVCRTKDGALRCTSQCKAEASAIRPAVRPPTSFCSS